MQLLKFEIFEKINCINAFTISNVHISLNEEEKSDNKQKKIVISKQNSKSCETHLKISLSELKDIQTVISK